MLVLIIVWSLFFAMYKYFVWEIFKTDTITLQYISGYLSIGTIGSFIVGWLLYELYREKKYHFSIGILTIVMLFCIFFVEKWWTNTAFFLATITIFLWFFYGLWWVLRNILVAWQIQETGIADTKINGMANIVFITSIILGTIFWGKIAEICDIQGLWVIVGILGIWICAGSLFVVSSNSQKHSKQEQIQSYKNEFYQDFCFIFRRYWVIMIFISVIITSGTILSQVAIEYFVDEKNMESSRAALILLYSAVGSIFGNVASMRIISHRWSFFLACMIAFAFLCITLPFTFFNIFYTNIAAGIAGIFFWVSYNLLESYFFKKIGDDGKKAYGSVSLGIVTAITIAIMMFWVDQVGNVHGVYSILWIMIFLMGMTIYIQRKKFI